MIKIKIIYENLKELIIILQRNKVVIKIIVQVSVLAETHTHTHTLPTWDYRYTSTYCIYIEE